MQFSPMPLLSLLAAAGLGVLLWLGVWQLGRADWKAEEIAAFEALQEAGPVSLEQALCGAIPEAGQPLQPVAADPQAPALSVYGRNADGAPGWRLFRPVDAPNCAEHPRLLAETGFRPLDGAAQPSGTAGVRLAKPLAAGPFTPPADMEAAEVYAYDATQAERALALEPGALSRDWWIELDDGALPERLSETPPERHVGYAATWFGLALTLIAVYAGFHVSTGRLSFTRFQDR